MKKMPSSIPAGKFKATCLQLMEQVNLYNAQVVITKHGKPIAKLVPMDNEPKVQAFGSMKNTVKIAGDIVKPIDVEWDAME